MGNLERLEKLQKLKENGSLSEEEFNVEKEKLLHKKNNAKSIIIVVLLVIIILVGGLIYHSISIKSSTDENVYTEEDNLEENSFEQASANISANGTESVSFGNMESDDDEYSEVQQEILKYFDNDYFPYYQSLASKYPQIFKNAKVTTDCTVIKVLSSTDDEFTVVAINSLLPNTTMSVEDVDDTSSLFILTGEQLTKRLVQGDTLTVYGRYNDLITTEIDGKSYTIPQITSINTISPVVGDDSSTRYSVSTIKTVAEYIFGKDIKVNEPVEGQDYTVGGATLSESGDFYKITLDNQSNSNFKVFNMYKNEGTITYNKIHNGLSDNIEKNLYVSADFQHYIVTTYDEDLDYVYIDYFNSDLEKVWSREFEYTSTKAFASPMDYTSTQMAIVVDNDLYLIDLETGENVIEPVMVGEKIKVLMMTDGIILIGDNAKDTFMKVDYNGNTLYRTDTTSGNLDDIQYAYTQIVDDKLVIYMTGTVYDEDVGDTPNAGFVVLNEDGTIEVETSGF